jgi:hypothetical protein
MILLKIMFAFRAWTAILALWRLIIPRPVGPRAYNSAADQNRLFHALNTRISILSSPVFQVSTRKPRLGRKRCTFWALILDTQITITCTYYFSDKCNHNRENTAYRVGSSVFQKVWHLLCHKNLQKCKIKHLVTRYKCRTVGIYSALTNTEV